MEMATVTVKLPTQLYTRLQERAREESTDVVELLNRLVDTSDAAPVTQMPITQAFQHMIERATDLGVTDLSEQHDHYLYGKSAD